MGKLSMMLLSFQFDITFIQEIEWFFEKILGINSYFKDVFETKVRSMAWKLMRTKNSSISVSAQIHETYKRGWVIKLGRSTFTMVTTIRLGLSESKRESWQSIASFIGNQKLLWWRTRVIPLDSSYYSYSRHV